VSLLQKEWEVKLDLLGSIARSQAALARMLHSVADVTEHGGITPATLHEHVRVLTSMQQSLLRTVTGVGWRAPVPGNPATPWLAGQVCRPERANGNCAGVSRL